MGTVTKFTPANVRDVLLGLSKGTPLTVVCDDLRIDPSTVWDWGRKDAELAQALAHARDLGHDRIAFECLAISNGMLPLEDEDGNALPRDVKRDKLRVWTRLQLLAIWNPSKYGQKVAVVGDPNKPIEHHHTHTLTPAEAYRKAIEGN